MSRANFDAFYIFFQDYIFQVQPAYQAEKQMNKSDITIENIDELQDRPHLMHACTHLARCV